MPDKKFVFLLRHAKSSWDSPKLPDKDRPLNSRGIRNVAEMGKRIATQGYRPDLILSSPAKRALTTACDIADAVNYPSRAIQIESELYFSGPDAMLEALTRQDDNIRSIMLVGHNPDISALLEIVSGTREDMPTCAFAIVGFDMDSWRDVARTSGNLLWYDFPKNRAK